MQDKKIENLICYICCKYIKVNDYYSIGKNKKNLELYRHKKCNPLKLSEEELNDRNNWVDNPEPIVKKKRKRKRKGHQ